MNELVLALLTAALGLPFSIMPLSVLRGGARAWDFAGTMTGAGGINGTLWVTPEFDKSGALLRVRTVQAESLSGLSVVFLGLSDQATAHYLQGELPASSPSQGCQGLGCSAFDEVLDCTEWNMAELWAFCNCTLKRVCGFGTGLTGWFTSNITVNGANVVGSYSAFEVGPAGGSVSMTLTERGFGDAPTNPCF